ncbi:19700_t:CDS:2 [Cetraspora pellucida]|uniref:19700_t:CDS:1 n=1 Tax=Cetraspora pellucida TaxID=1433469 RepID=A0A9N9ASB0_9GLOM|nr:19700_t:CDS:2 [Cetraspora pellucida]
MSISDELKDINDSTPEGRNKNGKENSDDTNITNRESLLSNDKIILKIRRIIYSSLEHYWHVSEHIGLIATLLVLRLKSMNMFSNKTQDRAIKELRAKFKTWQSIVVANNLVKVAEAEASSSSTPTFMKKIFSYNQTQINHKIEINNYLNKSIMLIKPKSIDVYN